MKEKVILITTDNEISIREIEAVNDSVLDDLQKLVDGYIEIVCLWFVPDSELAIICDEEGLLKGKEINVAASLMYGVLEHGNPIVGDVVLMKEGYRNGEPDIIGLADDECEDVYKQMLNCYSFLREGKLQ